MVYIVIKYEYNVDNLKNSIDCSYNVYYVFNKILISKLKLFKFCGFIILLSIKIVVLCFEFISLFVRLDFFIVVIK